MSSDLLKDLNKSLEYYEGRKDFRLHKLKNIISIIKEIENNPNIRIDVLLSKLSVTEPFLNKKTGLIYIKDMEKAGQIKVNKETKEVELCQ